MAQAADKHYMGIDIEFNGILEGMLMELVLLINATTMAWRLPK